MKRYKNTRLDIETHNLYTQKKRNMEAVASRLTGKKVRIPLITVMKISAKTPIYMKDYDLLKIIGDKRKK